MQQQPAAQETWGLGPRWDWHAGTPTGVQVHSLHHLALGEVSHAHLAHRVKPVRPACAKVLFACQGQLQLHRVGAPGTAVQPGQSGQCRGALPWNALQTGPAQCADWAFTRQAASSSTSEQAAHVQRHSHAPVQSHLGGIGRAGRHQVDTAIHHQVDAAGHGK